MKLCDAKGTAGFYVINVDLENVMCLFTSLNGMGSEDIVLAYPNISRPTRQCILTRTASELSCVEWHQGGCMKLMGFFFFERDMDGLSNS